MTLPASDRPCIAGLALPAKLLGKEFSTANGTKNEGNLQGRQWAEFENPERRGLYQ
jgi:hypothetical protein